MGCTRLVVFFQMEERIIQYISKYVSLDQHEVQEILKELEFRTFKKGTHLIAEGQVSKECYFNIQGLVRQYEVVEGDDKTTDFYAEGDAIVAFESGAHQLPCTFNWVCEEDTTLVIGRLDGIRDAYARNPKLEKMSGLFITGEFGRYQTRASRFITMTPEQRYLEFLEKRPHVINRIRQYHLASYLGIKPETLSRIRRKISRKL